MRSRITVSLPCELRYRNAVGSLIQEICRCLEHEGAEAGLTHQVISAFYEAFNNLVEHAYAGCAEAGPVEVVVEQTPTQLILLLMDEGRSFDLHEIEAPDLDTVPETGLGIFIIRSCMSEVEYTPGQGQSRNTMRMVKNLRDSTGHQPAGALQGSEKDA